MCTIGLSLFWFLFCEGLIFLHVYCNIKIKTFMFLLTLGFLLSSCLCPRGKVMYLGFSSDRLAIFFHLVQSMEIFILSLDFMQIPDCISWYQHQQRGNCT